MPSNLKRDRAISFFNINILVLPICIYLQLNKNNKSAILFPTLHVSPENYFVLVCGPPCVCPAVSTLSMSWVVFSVTVSGLSVKCDYYSFKIFLSCRNGKGVLDISKSFSTADCHQERGADCQNHLMDQNLNLIRAPKMCISLSQRL